MCLLDLVPRTAPFRAFYVPCFCAVLVSVSRMNTCFLRTLSARTKFVGSRDLSFGSLLTFCVICSGYRAEAEDRSDENRYEIDCA